MNDYSTIDSYLRSDRTVGQTKFDKLFTNYFEENVQVSKFTPSFFAMMFLGFNNMLLMDEIREEYGIHYVFFRWYEESSTLKAVVFMNKNGARSMKIRTIFLEKIENKAPILLSADGFHELAESVAIPNYDEQKFQKYRDALDAKLIKPDTEYTNYLNSEAGKRQKINLLMDYYPPEVKEYVLLVMKDSVTGRSRVSLKQSLDSENVQKNMRLEFQYGKRPDVMLMTSEILNNEEEKFELLNDHMFGIAETSKLLEFYKNIYSEEAHIGTDDENIMLTLGKTRELYNIQAKKFRLAQIKSQSIECGYTLGAFLAFHSTSNRRVETKVHQFISTEMMDYGLQYEFLLTLEPSFQSNIYNMATKKPAVITFSFDQIITLDMFFKCQIRSNIRSEYLLVNVVDYFHNSQKSTTFSTHSRNTFIEEVVRYGTFDHADTDQSIGQQLLGAYTRDYFNEIQPKESEHKLTDVTYLSRHIFGEMISSARHDGLSIKEMRPLDAGPLETTYVIHLPEGFGPTPSRKHIILNFNEHVNAHDIFEKRSELTDNFDTLFVRIAQNFEISSDDPHFGRIERSIEVHQAHFDSIKENKVFSQIDHISLDYLKSANDDDLKLFHRDLTNLLRRHQHLLDEPILPGYQQLVEQSSNYRAVIDGLFHFEPSMKNVIELPQSFSNVQYTIPGTSSNDAMHVNANGGMAQEPAPLRLTTINFKYITDADRGSSYIVDGMAHMIEKTSSAPETNRLVNFYFMANSEGVDPNEFAITKSEFLSICNGARKRRNLPSKCVEIIERKKSDADMLSEIKVTKITILDDVASISNYLMMGFMVRDLISDAYHGNTISVLKDVGFLTATALSPEIGKFVKYMAEIMLAEGMKISGYATKALGFGISRAISLHVLGDFIHNAMKYAENTNDTSAKQGMMVDGAFLTIDAVVLGIEALESAGYIYGVAAIANPLGAIFGAALILGLNTYQAIETLSNIQKFVILNDQELIDESLRAFLHFDPAANIKELINEKEANDYLMDRATDFLKQQNRYDTFITKSGVVNGNSVKLRQNAIINVQNKGRINISRASPKSNKILNVVCPLHEEADEIPTKRFWSKVEDLFANAFHSFKMLFYDLKFRGDAAAGMRDVVDMKLEGQIRGYDHICHNSLGFQLNNTSPYKAAYFDIGDGDDVVFGFTNKSNLFHLGSGKKFINGSDRSDVFILEDENINGILNGESGRDTVDFSAINSTKVFELANGYNSLDLKNIETVIGRLNIPDIVTCECSFQTVRLFGGQKDNPDLIVVPNNNCTYETSLYLDDYTRVFNHAGRGTFNYVINIKRHSSAKLEIYGEQNQSALIHNIVINNTFFSLKRIASFSSKSNVIQSLRFMNNANFTVVPSSSNESLLMHFIDGCQLSFLPNKTIHAILNSSLSIEDISKQYRDKIRHLGISMIAYSTTDNETIMINGKNPVGPNIIHNFLSSPTRLFIENCGNYLLLVDALLSEGGLSFPAIRLHIANCSCSRLTIDFNKLIDRLQKLDIADSLNLFAVQNENNLLLNVSIQNSTLKHYFIGKLTVENVFENQCFKNITIRSYNDLSVLDHESSDMKITPDHQPSDEYVKQQASAYSDNLLLPQPLIYKSMFKFILLSVTNTEWFSRVKINAILGKLEFYHVSNISLFVTNMRTLEKNDSVNLFSAYLEKFYDSKKLWTLTIEDDYSRTSLLSHLDGIRAASSFADLFKYYKLQ